ncbi:MAG: aromatic ring-hydroxylating dioxygenase subunit alpha [Planctomycetaceae bacterium]|nr:aromatic ring-hydroxylating dioxygenase subunit alpha [Planctomycetaceae bacterium]
MFLSDSHLPQLLTAEDYTSQEQFQRELDRLFLPSWQLVGTMSDLKQEGDFFTFELLGHPLIIWRTEGRPRAYLNVCPHRFSRMKSETCGNTGERLRCQYHGWEFDCDGQTRKIPDAQSFRPLTKGAMRLTEFPVETAGQLIFVRLTDAPGPSLSEFLGPFDEIARSCFDENRVCYDRIDMEVEANWKVKVENGMESYHVDQIHSGTFGRMPDSSSCTHELQENRSTFATVEETEDRVTQALDRFIHGLAGQEPDWEYKHYMFYPNFMFIKMRLFTWAETVLPIAPNRTRLYTILFCHGGRPGSLRGRIARRMMSSWGRRFIRIVAQEDAEIIPEVQRGLAAARRPSTGVVSVREERCFHFQEYIRRNTSAETEQRQTPNGTTDGETSLVHS